MYKDNPVGNVGAEMGRDLVFMTTARLSDLSMPLKGGVWRSTWTVCTAADCEERQICTTCLFAESIGLWKVDGLVCFLQHTSVQEGIVVLEPVPEFKHFAPLPRQHLFLSLDRFLLMNRIRIGLLSFQQHVRNTWTSAFEIPVLRDRVTMATEACIRNCIARWVHFWPRLAPLPT